MIIGGMNWYRQDYEIINKESSRKTLKSIKINAVNDDIFEVAVAA